MSQRNPMNERYTSDERTGKTRKSAAAAKPKAQAAASVVVKKAGKTPQERKKQRKAEQKAERKKAQAQQRELDRKYYTPDTDRYRKLRKLWWVLLVCAILCTLVSFFFRANLPEGLSMAILLAAYAFIIAAFYIDFAKIRKERMAYQDRMLAIEEQQKREAKAAERAAATKASVKKGKKRGKPTTAKAVNEDSADTEASEEVEPQKTRASRLFRFRKTTTAPVESASADTEEAKGE